MKSYNRLCPENIIYNEIINKWMDTAFLNNSSFKPSTDLHTAAHLFTKSVSCRSAKFTTGDFECMVRLKRLSLQKSMESGRGWTRESRIQWRVW